MSKREKTEVSSDADLRKMRVDDTDVLGLKDIEEILPPSRPEPTGVTSVEGPVDTGQMAEMADTVTDDGVADTMAARETGERVDYRGKTVKELEMMIRRAKAELERRNPSVPDRARLDEERRLVRGGVFPLNESLSEMSQQADPVAFKNTLKKAAGIFREIGFDVFQSQFESGNISPSVIHQLMMNGNLVDLTKHEVQELKIIMDRKRQYKKSTDAKDEKIYADAA